MSTDTTAPPRDRHPPGEPSAIRRRPVTTYRLQLTDTFSLASAAGVLPYLARLGITDCYTSPYLMAAEQSLSGYDVCDHQRIQPELGGEGALETFAGALRASALGHVLDFVPNHMGTDTRRNGWWRDVLAYGQQSRFADHFDIDWTPTTAELRGRLLLPILGKPYGEALDDGDIRLEPAAGGFVVRYGPIELPLNPATVPSALDGAAMSPDALHALLERQIYRLAYWRTSADEINYRRFFDVDGLIGVRMERPDVFTDAHRYLATLIARGLVTSLRIDHPDGLAAPVEYFDRLRALTREATGGDPLHVVVEKILGDDERLPADWPVDGTTGYDFLARVNGLLVTPTGGVALERLFARLTAHPASFAKAAYESKKLVMTTTLASEVQMLAHALNQIAERQRRSRDFTETNLRQALIEFVACLPVYRTYLGPPVPPEAEAARVRQTAHRARRLNEHLEGSVFAFLEAVLLEGTAEAAAYPPADGADAADRRRFTARLQQFTGSAVAKGIEDTACYRYVPLLSACEVGGRPGRPSFAPRDLHDENQRRAEAGARGFLTTATHDTKLGEDARARLNVLSERVSDWSRTVRRGRLLGRTARTAGEDGPLPDAVDEYRFFQALIGTLPATTLAEAAPVLSPDYPARLIDYMRKAAREAKRHTSWVNPNPAYEDALTAFVTRTLGSTAFRRFRDALWPFAREVARVGAVNSLAQLVLKLASPGITDLYQGTELWDLSLVDPDNRRPVDFAAREELLAGLEPLLSRVAHGDDGVGPDLAALLADWPSGRVKLFVTAAGVRLRRRRPDLCFEATYEPAPAETPGPAEIVAFVRRRPTSGLLAVVPRFVATTMAEANAWPLGEAAWPAARVRLPADLSGVSLTSVFTGRRVAVDTLGGVVGASVASLLNDLPVALWTWGTVE